MLQKSVHGDMSRPSLVPGSVVDNRELSEKSGIFRGLYLTPPKPERYDNASYAPQGPNALLLLQRGPWAILQYVTTYKDALM